MLTTHSTCPNVLTSFQAVFDNFLGRFDNFLNRFDNRLSRFDNFLSHVDICFSRFDNLLSRFDTFLSRFALTYKTKRNLDCGCPSFDRSCSLNLLLSRIHSFCKNTEVVNLKDDQLINMMFQILIAVTVLLTIARKGIELTMGKFLLFG